MKKIIWGGAAIFLFSIALPTQAKETETQKNDSVIKDHWQAVSEMKKDYRIKLTTQNLFLASYKGDTKKIEKILKNNPPDIINSSASSTYLSAFEIACKYGVEPSVIYFVKNCGEHLIRTPNNTRYDDRYRDVGFSSRLPVRLAVGNGHIKIVDMLYKAGFPLLYNHYDKEGEMLFDYAVYRGYFDIAEYILKKLTGGFQNRYPALAKFTSSLLVNFQNSKERDKRGIAGLKFLLNSGFNPWAKEEGKYKENAVECALSESWDAGVKFFIEKGYVTIDMIDEYAPTEKSELYKKILADNSK